MTIPQIFKTFKDRNNLKRKKKLKPKLFSDDLGNLVDLLSSKIVHLWLCKSSFTKLHTSIVDLLDITDKILQHMKTNIVKSCHVKSLTMSVIKPDSNSQVSEIKQTNVIRLEYNKHMNAALLLNLSQKISMLEDTG